MCSVDGKPVKTLRACLMLDTVTQTMWILIIFSSLGE